MNKIKFIDLEKQYKLYKKEIDKEIKTVINSTSFIMGKQIQDLESELSKFVRVKHAIGVSSGTDALLLSLIAYDIKNGDEIITTPFTFIATAEVIALLGANPVFVDIDDKTYNIDYSKIESAITKKTKGIIPVSIFGQCADIDEINSIAKKNRLFVIEDGCQSFGAVYKGKRSCGITDIGTTSFFPSKPLGCYGDGGMVFTNNDTIAAKIRKLLNHGQKERYKHELIGINGRLDTLQAAILLAKLKYFLNEIEKRIKKGKYYSDKLKKFVITPFIKEYNKSVYAQYSIRVKNRDLISNYLNKKGIPTAIHYPVPIHLQEAFKYLKYKKGDFPIAEKLSEEIISIPFYPEIEQKDQDYIINSITDFNKFV